MKRIGNLYEKIISIENLTLADEKARKGKRNSYGVVQHDKNREENLLRLHQQLVNKTFKTSEYSTFKIYEPKERVIFRLPYYPDRILHHAIMNVMEPVWVRLFTADTYACIKGRGIHGIVRKLKRDLLDVEATKYCLKMDIKKYYPSIDHEVLKNILRRKIKDNDLLELIDSIIDSAPGVPIGNYLSQYFANIYLSYFDHWLKEEKKVKYYYRYADDLVLLSDDKKYLRELLGDVRGYFARELNVEIKGNYQIFHIDSRGIDFVGYKFFHTHILMRKSIKKRFIKAIKKSHTNNLKVKHSAYFGWAAHCNSLNLLKKLSAA